MNFNSKNIIKAVCNEVSNNIKNTIKQSIQQYTVNNINNNQQQASAIGAYGELTVSKVLKSLPSEYHVVNDILLQQGIMYQPYDQQRAMQYSGTPWNLVNRNGRVYEEVKKSTQIDHVVVSPYGIFVIETKNYKGFIYGDTDGKMWTQVLLAGKSGTRHNKFYSPVKQNQTHIRVLSQQLEISDKFMGGIIVFTNPQANLQNVNCSYCVNIEYLCNTILNCRDRLWNYMEVNNIMGLINKIDTNNPVTNQEHITYVQYLQNKRKY